MEDKIIEKIDSCRNDNKSYIEYINAFCDSEKIKEAFKTKEEFKLLQEYLSDRIQKEEEY